MGIGDVLAKPLVVVTGKGGVGKTTVAAALAVLATRRGLRTIVAEVARRGDVPRLLGDGHPDVHHISIDPQQALEEYLTDQLPLRSLADLLASSRLFSYLAAATPGMRELLTIGKAWDLTQEVPRTGTGRYDLVLLDAPATGHGVAVLSAPSTFAEAARVGPVARQGRTIHAALSDPARTGVVAVTTGEETPVNETLALRAALRAGIGLDLDAVVANRLWPDRVGVAGAQALAGIEGDDPAVRAALAGHAKARTQRAQLARLRRGLDQPPIRLPHVVTGGDLDAVAIDRLADVLEAAL
jgi:anion-transporting  ArsA/GET3 family ATPase